MMKILSILLCLTLLSVSPIAKAWLPDQNPIRGVNLGGLFVAEQWMMNDQWVSIGCGGTNDEWQCVQALGQTAADAAFGQHWSTWITQDDIKEIASYGLNTIRIPLGFWMKEDPVRSDEFLDQRRIAIPGTGMQVGEGCRTLHNPGTSCWAGQKAAVQPQFFNSDNYERAYQFLEWLTRIRHTNNNFAKVGAIQVMNEPRPPTDDARSSLVNEYYPNAYNRIRAVEDSLNIAATDRLYIQFRIPGGEQATRNNPGEALHTLQCSTITSICTGTKEFRPIAVTTCTTLVSMMLVLEATAATSSVGGGVESEPQG